MNRSDSVRWSVDIRFRQTPGYRELGERARIGYDAPQPALDRSARPALVVRSHNPETLSDYSSWDGTRHRLQQEAARAGTPADRRHRGPASHPPTSPPE